jgi:MtfA peptidase
MFTNRIALPFLLTALLFLYLSWTKDPAYAPWIIPFLLISVVIYVLSPQINWWYYVRRPQDLPMKDRDILERCMPFYQQLTPGDKKKFRERLFLFQLGNDWTPMGWPDDNMPQDVRLALSAQAVALLFGKPDLVFKRFEKVIIYPLPFPSPEYDFPHASELHEADGCLLFSAQQLMPAFFNPGSRYNIGLHEYAKAFVLSWPSEPYPAWPDDAVWDRLEQVSRMPRAHVESVVGLAGLEPLPVAIHHYFSFAEAFRQEFPEESATFDLIFSVKNA